MTEREISPAAIPAAGMREASPAVADGSSLPRLDEYTRLLEDVVVPLQTARVRDVS